MRRAFGQLSPADGLVSARSEALNRIADLVDWTAPETLLGEPNEAGNRKSTAAGGQRPLAGDTR